MKKNNQNSLLVEQLNSVQQLLSNETLDDTILYEVAAEISQFGEIAHESARADLQRGAILLSQVSELAAGMASDANQENGNGFIEFIINNVLAMDDAIAVKDASKTIDAFIKKATHKWGDYLSLVESDSLGNSWTNDPKTTSKNEQEPSQSDDDIQMMLAALSQAAETETKAPVERKNASKKKPSQKKRLESPPKAKKKTAAKDLTPKKSTAKTTTTQKAANKKSKKPKPAKPTPVIAPAADADAEAKKTLAEDQDLLEAYLDDALRCLSSMEQSAMAVEDSPEDREPVRQFCRELHTLKGASASVGLSDLAAYIHDLESSLETIFDGEDAYEVEPLFEAVDLVRELVGSLQKPVANETDPQAEAIENQSSNKSSPTPTQKSKPEFASFASTNDDASIRIRAAKLDRLMDMLAELVVLRNRRESHVTEFNELNSELVRCADRVGFADEQWQEISQLEQESESFGAVRPDTNMSEVAKDIAAVSQGLRDLQKPVSQDNTAISRFISDFRQELMQLRRVPVSGLFSRLQRAARDAAKTEKKKVQVTLLGEHAGLEQEIQERLYESLLHVVRNSVSHGIESEAQRKKSGKDPVGNVTLEATSNAQLLIIEVRDDGGGINYGAVRKRATEKGLIGPDDHPSKDELARLIFHPGFSTRETASAVSGRGVGMDIVATTIEQLHGRIEIDSVAGEGTTIRLLIPLRTGIEHVMVFRSAGQLFALPMQSVTAAKADNKELTKISLGSALGLKKSDTADCVSAEDVLVLRKGNESFRNRDNSDSSKRFAIGVDELVGPEEVVVRGLPNLLKNHPLFCGITLSGSGDKVLLLDTDRIVDFCNGHQSDQSTDVSEFDPQPHSQGDKKTVLVVDDSLTARKVLVKILRKHDFNIAQAGDGVEAIEKLHRGNFDLVMTDLDMPRMGGLELLSDMQSGKYSDASTVVVSSRREQTFRDKAMELGADDYLTKPLSESSVLQMLERLELMPENVKG